jgi:hypothetical protein
MRIRTQCKSCGLPFAALLRGGETLICPQCGVGRPVALEGWSDGRPGTVDRCPLCDCAHLYRQKDVHRGWGCAIVALGAALSPWTWGLSLALCVLIDIWWSRRIPEAVVCYRCDTAFRDARPLPRQGEFDLLKHDVMKYGKTWEPNEPAQEKTPEA